LSISADAIKKMTSLAISCKDSNAQSGARARVRVAAVDITTARVITTSSTFTGPHRVRCRRSICAHDLSPFQKIRSLSWENEDILAGRRVNRH